MELIFALVILYFIGGIVFLTKERFKARRKIMIMEIINQTNQNPVSRITGKLKTRKQRNLLNATWKENIIIITLWIFKDYLKGA